MIFVFWMLSFKPTFRAFSLSSFTFIKRLFSSSSLSAIRVVSSAYLLLLSHFSRVRLCVTPEMAAHQASPSLGFSRQVHWSGLPFPSPMQESEKWKWSHSVMSVPERPHGLQPSRLLRPWNFPGKSTRVGCHCLLPSAYLRLLIFLPAILIPVCASSSLAFCMMYSA